MIKKIVFLDIRFQERHYENIWKYSEDIYLLIWIGRCKCIKRQKNVDYIKGIESENKNQGVSRILTFGKILRRIVVLMRAKRKKNYVFYANAYYPYLI